MTESGKKKNSADRAGLLRQADADGQSEILTTDFSDYHG
jgi:hypothetical protein